MSNVKRGSTLEMKLLTEPQNILANVQKLLHTSQEELQRVDIIADFGAAITAMLQDEAVNVPSGQTSRHLVVDSYVSVANVKLVFTVLDGTVNRVNVAVTDTRKTVVPVATIRGQGTSRGIHHHSGFMKRM